MLPCIDETTVREAINALQTMRTFESPLMHLRLVDEIVADPTFPCGEDCRQYALNLLLVSTIAREYTALRQTFGGQAPSQTETYAEALQAIALDSHRDNTTLLAWGWLYHRFVRVDLEIDAQAFSKAAGIHERTLRRYQRRAITDLTTRLRQDEQMIRQRPAADEVRQMNMRDARAVNDEAQASTTSLKTLFAVLRSLFNL